MARDCAIGEVTGLSPRGHGRDGCRGRRRDDSADAIVIAMGPWSLRAAEWLALPAVFGLQSPSLVYDTGEDVPAEALFLDYSEDGGSAVTVEVFPRADGSTHVAAFSGQSPLPMNPADVKPDPGAIARLQALCERLSPAFRRGHGSSRGKPASAR